MIPIQHTPDSFHFNLIWGADLPGTGQPIWIFNRHCTGIQDRVLRIAIPKLYVVDVNTMHPMELSLKVQSPEMSAQSLDSYASVDRPGKPTSPYSSSIPTSYTPTSTTNTHGVHEPPIDRPLSWDSLTD